MIPIEECEARRVYRIRCRNLLVGVWNPVTRGFMGIRRKFDSEYLFTEYHHDADPHLGTVHWAEPLDRVIPEDMLFAERLEGSWCSEHERRVWWKPDQPEGKVGKWFHLDDESALEKPDFPMSRSNTALFDLLKPLHEAEVERLVEERRLERQEAESKRMAPQTLEEYEREQRLAVVDEWVKEQRAQGLTYRDFMDEYHERRHRAEQGE